VFCGFKLNLAFYSNTVTHWERGQREWSPGFWRASLPIIAGKSSVAGDPLESYGRRGPKYPGRTLVGETPGTWKGGGGPIGGDLMVKLLGKLASLFRPTACVRGRGSTTKMRRETKDFGDEIFLTTPSSVRFLRFPRINWPFTVSPALNSLDFFATVTAFSCPFT